MYATEIVVPMSATMTFLRSTPLHQRVQWVESSDRVASNPASASNGEGARRPAMRARMSRARVESDLTGRTRVIA